MDEEIKTSESGCGIESSTMSRDESTDRPRDRSGNWKRYVLMPCALGANRLPDDLTWIAQVTRHWCVPAINIILIKHTGKEIIAHRSVVRYTSKSYNSKKLYYS
jgi:hypothetical protein